MIELDRHYSKAQSANKTGQSRLRHCRRHSTSGRSVPLPDPAARIGASNPGNQRAIELQRKKVPIAPANGEPLG